MNNEIKNIFKQAEDGDVYSMCEIANCYNSGEHLEKNLEKAFEYYKKAADLGFAPAEFQVGIRYCKGQGVKIDKKLGSKYIINSADKGYVNAQYIAGETIYNGIFEKKKAFKYLLKASKQGHVDAQFKVGSLYFLGKGVKSSVTESIFWLSCSYIQGNAKATDTLNYFLKQGLPGGRKKIDDIINDIKHNYPMYIKKIIN